MPERIGPTPDRSERSQASRIQHVEDFEICVDGFCAFDVKDRCQDALAHASSDIADAAADTDAALRLPLDPEKQGDHVENDALGRCRIDGRGHRRIDSYVWRGCIARRTTRSAGRRDENRKQPSGEPSLERLRKIHVTLGLSIEERLRPISAATPVQTQQNVVVAVKDWNPRRCHGSGETVYVLGRVNAALGGGIEAFGSEDGCGGRCGDEFDQRGGGLRTRCAGADGGHIGGGKLDFARERPHEFGARER